MVKLTSLKTKTAIEVTDDDLLLIEDKEDTKTITVDQFKIVMNSYTEARVKALFNECLDNVSKALEKAKFVIPITRKFATNIWIGSDSGNIQITIRDLKTGKWFTREELVNLLLDEDGNIANDFSVKVFADGIYNTAQSYQLLNFVDYHTRGDNEWLFDDNAGFIKASFKDLTHNGIAAITYEDVEVNIKNRTFVPEDEEEKLQEYEFIFINTPGSFANGIRYESVIPPGDPIWLNGRM